MIGIETGPQGESQAFTPIYHGTSTITTTKHFIAFKLVQAIKHLDASKNA